MTHRPVASVGALHSELSETTCHGLRCLGPQAHLDPAHCRFRGQYCQCPRGVWKIVD